MMELLPIPCGYTIYIEDDWLLEQSGDLLATGTSRKRPLGMYAVFRNLAYHGTPAVRVNVYKSGVVDVFSSGVDLHFRYYPIKYVNWCLRAVMYEACKEKARRGVV